VSESDIGVCLGPPLSRHDCPNCGDNSLHRRGKCVHCGRQAMPSPAVVVTDKRDWVITRRKAPMRTSRA
jgi:hypothetical protein